MRKYNKTNYKKYFEDCLKYDPNPSHIISFEKWKHIQPAHDKLLKEINGVKPQHRIYSHNPNTDYYYCKVCKKHFDYKIRNEMNAITHCGQPMMLKHSYIIS